MTAHVDLVIQHGRVIDPANNVDKITNVLINDGKIVMVGDVPPDLKPKNIYNASGCLVTPGLIDLHAHVFEYATPLGVNVDETCLARGVTTVVDAGSAGILCLSFTFFFFRVCEVSIQCVAIRHNDICYVIGGKIIYLSNTLVQCYSRG